RPHRRQAPRAQLPQARRDRPLERVRARLGARRALRLRAALARKLALAGCSRLPLAVPVVNAAVARPCSPPVWPVVSGYLCQVDDLLTVTLADAPAIAPPRRATIIDFEPEAEPWPDTGVNVQVMQPGQPNGRYHSEPVQEDFLVLQGECIAIIEGEE